MQRSQGTQRLPPGQRWQSLSHRACVQHDPCAPEAEWSDRHLRASGKVPLSSLSPWRRDHQGHKDHMSVGEKGCERVLPYRERESILQLISTSRRNVRSISERRGQVSNQGSLGLLHHIPFTSQRSFFGWSHSWSFLSHSVGCSWVYRWGSWLIRSCGRGNTPAWTELTWAHRGLGKQCPEACRGWLLEQWHPQNWLNKSSLQGWPGCEEMPWDGIVPQAWALSETEKENDCYLQCNELAGQKHFLNIFWPF